MEYVEGILYHKIQESDFTNMYVIKKPAGGGGQTYIQAAGYSKDELDRMFWEAERVYDTPEFWDKDFRFPRKNYTIDAYEIGTLRHGKIELAPRTGRKDYRICRQNPKYRHPAWQVESGFPAPRTDGNGSYIFEENYPGLIDNLYIMIVKTRDRDEKAKFYATYVNSELIPDLWPHGAGLEEIFLKSKRQGILFFDDQYLRFVNDKEAPFQNGSAVDEEMGNIPLPEDLCETTDDAVEYFNTELKINIDYDKVDIQKVEPPILKRRKTEGTGKRVLKAANYENRQKNLKKIGQAGEMLAIKIEKARLEKEGRSDLASKIEHVSETIGDGLGYDIKSFECIEGVYREKYIEVKATTGGKSKPFDISANEVEVSEEKGVHYCIYRFFGISGKTNKFKYYEVRGSVKDNFTLEATSYKAYYKP